MGTFNKYTDEELVGLLPSTDEQVFCEIYWRYREMLSGYAIKLTDSYEDANDVVQEVFTQLWHNRFKLTITHSLKAYLFACVRNGCFRLLENTKRFNGLVAGLTAYLNECSSEPLPHLEAKELQETVDRIVDNMPGRMKEVYVLSRRTELSHREIGGQLKIAESTVKKQVQKALHLIRQQLAKATTAGFLLLAGIFLFFFK